MWFFNKKEEVVPEDEVVVLFTVDWDKVETIDDLKLFLHRQYPKVYLKGTMKEMRTSPMRKFVKGFEKHENTR